MQTLAKSACDRSARRRRQESERGSGDDDDDGGGGDDFAQRDASSELYPKEAIAATFLKIDRFSERLGAIRRQLADRRQHELRPSEAVPLQRNNHADLEDGPSVALPPLPTRRSARDAGVDVLSDQIKLPRLLDVAQPARVTEPTFDGRLLSMDGMRSRAGDKNQYDAAWEHLQRVEQQAAAAVQEADRLTEDARIAMVLYAKNERSWNFDERARRYQQVMQAKKEAEGARLKADDDRILAQCLRAQTKDPHRAYRSHVREGRGHEKTATLKPIAPPGHDTVYAWILASPLLVLPFTPRDISPGTVLCGEKELSTHVVYYAAASSMTVNEAGHENDKPPSDGWLCCSSHGTPPAPTITPVKSSIETWLVTGAGAVHLNGKYLFSGVHNGTRKFKNTAGVELFRKELPKTSSIIQGVVEVVVESQNEAPENRSNNSTGNQSNQLPSTLRALEQSDKDFKSMGKIGAWMSSDNLQQKRRRIRDAGAVGEVGRQDGDHVLTQETSSQRLNPTDVVRSRPDANAALCREWVLFMRCSRRIDKPLSDVPKRNLGLGCLKRHYYISSEEKDTMTVWAHEQEAWLEKDVLTAIIRREAYIERASRSCQKCMSKFQQDLREETEVLLHRVLRELNTIRFLTVKVLEAIEMWRSHARKRGFTTYEDDASEDSSKPSTLGWSSSVTVKTGKKLFKGSHAFASKFKRFCRPEDPHGQDETRLVYLGYYATRDEAELAYDDFATAEARRLNTTVGHLPRRRNVFRSCGKHFSVESERLGPDYCIECASKQVSTGGPATSASTNTDDWSPPFFYPSGQNYILKLGNDLDFLDQVLPLKNRLNQQRLGGSNDDPVGVFPLLGNVFLLPKTPLQDPDLVFFSSLMGSGAVPRLRGSEDNQDEDHHFILEEALDVERILKAQQIFLQEMQIYHPELFQHSASCSDSNQTAEKSLNLRGQIEGNPQNARRIVQALYWDLCAALQIQQERAPLPFRQDGIWCRPDAGEWASLLVRGKHQQHVLFENRLAKAGKETQERRKKALKIIRKVLKTPIYYLPSREIILSVIADGEHVKGDVVLLEVKSAYKFLDKYDLWCIKAVVVQRWYRGSRGRRRTRATRRALNLATAARYRYMEGVYTVSTKFYIEEVVSAAMRSAMKKLRRPMYSRTVKIDGELVIVGIHRNESASSTSERAVHKPSMKQQICKSCARRFHITTCYNAHANAFQVTSPVCCCALNGPITLLSESWVVRAYNPFANINYRLVIQNDLLSQLLRLEMVTGRGTGAIAHNPLSHCESSSKAVDSATSFGNYVDTLATRAFEQWTNWRILSEEATQRRKNAEIDLQRARERVVKLAKCLEVATVDARRALDFTSRPFEEAQAWDPLENANDWRLLVEKRHTLKELSSATDDADTCHFELFQAKADESSLRVQSAELRRIYESYWKPLLEYHEGIVKECTIELEKNQANAICVMSRLCTSRLALRDTFLAPTRRALVIAPNIWHRADTTMARMLMIAVPGLQRGRNTIRRQAMQLSDQGKGGDRRCVRLIVDVSAWTTRPSASAGERRNVWVSAYNPATALMQTVYLEWELVQLLATVPIVRPRKAHERERWVRIADKLLSLCMLDRFTGEFTLRKLQFYHHLRLLRPQFLASRWFQDLKRGRKCGDGDEIFRQAVIISGKLCFVAVYENWGDLVVRVYRSSSAGIRTLRISLTQAFSLLAQKPLALHLWICCVKSNQYTAAAITTLLKFVRITDSDYLAIVRDQGPRSIVASSTSSTLSIYLAAKIQQRRVLLLFKDALGDDLSVSAYDLTSNKKFQLLLEWENIRRVLNASKVQETGGGAARRRNLTLTRNRRELCQWISSRLRFQNLMEHPDTLASSFSPLVSGVQIRSSFLLFNEWISTSVRNPLSEVSQSTIDKFAAEADASLFHGLAHEQLVFVPQVRLPSSYEKEFLQTRDFIARGVAASKLGKSSRHLKIDFYTKAHQLFARVRHEMEQEIITRHETEQRNIMEKEEELALRQEIHAECDIANDELRRCCGALRTAQNSIEDRLVKTELLFNELCKRMAERPSASGKKKPVVCKPKPSGDTQEDNNFDVAVVASRLLACVRERGDAAHAILCLQGFGLNGTLRTLLQKIRQVEVHVTDVWVPSVEAVHAKANDVVQNGSHLVILQTTRLDLLACHHALSCTYEAEASEVEDNTEDDEVISPKEEQVDSYCACVEKGAKTAAPLLGFLLQPDGPVEEVMIELGQGLAPIFLDVSKAVSRELMPMFTRSAGSKKLLPPAQLHVKRVPLGLVVFDGVKVGDAPPRSHPWNSRATALAMEPVAGIAVFIPLIEDIIGAVFLDMDSLYRSLTWFEPNEVLKKPRPSSGALGAARRRTIQRSKQLLPWKQLSVERMQTARKLRQQRIRMGLLIARVDEDDEREKHTLGVYNTSHHHLEWLCGGENAHPIEARTLATVSDSLRLRIRDGWTVQLEREHQMLQLFDESHLMQAVPSELSTNQLQLGHVRVEADDWHSPRRFIFSCQELQSRRQYFADCSHAQLRQLAHVASDCALHWPVDQLSVHGWRKLALAAASRLAFRRQNGVLGLVFVEQRPPPRADLITTRALESSIEPTSLSRSSGTTTQADEVQEPSVMPVDLSIESSLPVMRVAHYELQLSIRLCRSRRFLKHQSGMRHAAAAQQREQVHNIMVDRHLGLEWLRMTQEDWSSQEFRGFLTLDDKELKKIRHAFTRVHQRLLGSNATPNTHAAVMGQWFADVVKEMGVKEHDKTTAAETRARYEHEAERYLSTMGRSKWWDDKHATDEPLILDATDVAEWWRRQRHVYKSDKSKPEPGALQ